MKLILHRIQIKQIIVGSVTGQLLMLSLVRGLKRRVSVGTFLSLTHLVLLLEELTLPPWTSLSVDLLD